MHAVTKVNKLLLLLLSPLCFIKLQCFVLTYVFDCQLHYTNLLLLLCLLLGCSSDHDIS